MKTVYKTLAFGMLALVAAQVVHAQNKVATAVIRPSAGGKLAIEIKESFPTAAPFSGYAVHAYGVSTVVMTFSGNATAGILIPGVPSKLKVFNISSGDSTEVEVGKPPIVVAGAVILPDNFAVLNCNGDTYFAAATIGEKTAQGQSAGPYIESYLISATGSTLTGSYPNNRSLNLSRIQYNAGAPNGQAIIALCWAPLYGYVGY